MTLQIFTKRFLLLALAVAAFGFSAQAQSSKMQSLMNDIKAEFPGRQKEIAEKCDGASVVMDVDFASFGDNYDALLRVPSQGLKETTYGFRRFCTNSTRTSEFDPAKTGAVKAKVKKILLRHISDPAGKKVSLQSGGVVLIEMAFDKLPGGLSTSEIAARLGDVL